MSTPSGNHLHSLSPTHFLPRAAEVEPNATAIHHVTSTGQLLRRTYKEFALRAAGLAYYLKQTNSSRVGILAPNTPAFLESIFGIAGAGCVQVAVNYRLKADDIQYILEHSEVDLVIVDAEYASLLAAFSRSHPNVPILVDNDAGDEDGPFNQAILEGLKIDHSRGGLGWAGLEAQSPNEDGMLALAYTSGTTSRPKGVIYTHRGVYLAALGNVVESHLNLDEGRCGYLWVLPLFHAMGWTFPWAITAVRGTHYCLRKIDYPHIWQLLKKEPITNFCAAPTVNTLLCRDEEAARLPRRVQVTVAGSPPSAVLFEQMTKLNLRPVHAYGLTETYGPMIMSYYLPEWNDLPAEQRYANMARQGHSMVTALPARVVKPGQEGSELIGVANNASEMGEIVVQGNLCTKGYYKDSAATKKLFDGGWMRTGDLAVWHSDGAIQIQDRAKDIIISGGENISSTAVESALVKHPAVVEAAVIGVPDERWGETPKAFVTVAPMSRVNGQEIRTWALDNSELGRFMVPREIEIVKDLPKTATGKIQKNVLREREKKLKERSAKL
ncbi:hypothetical protein BDV18DRAFT_167499 [Aspergillus unguis]